MQRRAFLCAILAPSLLRADAESEVWDLASSAVTFLVEGNASAFLGAFDPAMPGFPEFRSAVTALLQIADLQCTLDLVSNEGDSEGRLLVIDWLMRLTLKAQATPAASRRDRVKLRFERVRKKWKIVSFEPRAFLSPTGLPRA